MFQFFFSLILSISFFIFSFFISFFIFLFQFLFSIYQFCHLFLSIFLFFLIKFLIFLYKNFLLYFFNTFEDKLKLKLKNSTSYREWFLYAIEYEQYKQTQQQQQTEQEKKQKEQKTKRKEYQTEQQINLHIQKQETNQQQRTQEDIQDIHDNNHCLTYKKLNNTINYLRSLRLNNKYKNLLYELPGLIKRNHLGIDSNEFFTFSLININNTIKEYNEEILLCLKYLANLNISNNKNNLTLFDLNNNNNDDNYNFTLHEKINFFQKLSKNIGNTALCLSGGGSLSMYHMGVLRALIEGGHYKNVNSQFFSSFFF